MTKQMFRRWQSLEGEITSIPQLFHDCCMIGQEKPLKEWWLALSGKLFVIKICSWAVFREIATPSLCGISLTHSADLCQISRNQLQGSNRTITGIHTESRNPEYNVSHFLQVYPQCSWLVWIPSSCGGHWHRWRDPEVSSVPVRQGNLPCCRVISGRWVMSIHGITKTIVLEL